MGDGGVGSLLLTIYGGNKQNRKKVSLFLSKKDIQ